MSHKKDPPENACSIIRELAAKGADQRTIARAFDVNFKTFNRWREDHEEIAEALADGRSQEHEALVGTLLDVALNGTGKEKVTAAIFLLKARHGYNENALQNQDAPQVQINFELPGALDVKTYEAQVLKKAVGPSKKDKK